MKKTTKKPLALSTQTVRSLSTLETLDAEQMKNIVGGTEIGPSSAHSGRCTRVCM